MMPWNYENSELSFFSNGYSSYGLIGNYHATGSSATCSPFEGLISKTANFSPSKHLFYFHDDAVKLWKLGAFILF